MKSNDSTPICKYTHVDMGEGSNTWECSECEKVWQFNEGMPSENGFKYCPFCGSYIVEESVFHDCEIEAVPFLRKKANQSK